jgi:large subunit ribosomal protein L5
MSFKDIYTKEVIPKLREEFSYANVFEVPKVEKVVLNVGLGKGLKDKAFIDAAENTLTRITGQKPVPTKARKSISNFKIREGMVIGMKVTLRGPKMYDFIEKMIKITLPRIRDFRGVAPSTVDHKGNLNLGIREHVAFPEIKADEIERIHGLEIAFVTNAKTKKEGLALFKALGVPFKEEVTKKK